MSHSETVMGDETFAEIMADVEKADSRAVGNGFTSAALAQSRGISQDCAQGYIRKWFRAGQIEFAGKTKVPRVCGGFSLVPCYRRKQQSTANKRPKKK